MDTHLAASAGLRTALAGAYGAGTGPGSVGTGQLLVGLCVRGAGRVGAVLDEFDLTTMTVMHVLRKGTFAVDEGGPDTTSDLGPLEWYGGKKPMNYTAPARAAMTAAVAAATRAGRTEVDTDDVLRALLVGPNRATEVLSICGVEPAAVLARLSGGPAPARRGESGDPDLRPTRDALFGRAEYRSGTFTGRFTLGMLRAVGVNLAATPLPWIGMDARDQAQRLGHRRVRTAHALLAVLAVYEVTRDAPYLVEGVADRYAGAAALAGTGLTYAAARAVVAAAPPARDPRRLRSYLDGKRDTTALLAAILAGDTSAYRVLRTLGLDRPDLS